jgi:hypothetical protein
VSLFTEHISAYFPSYTLEAVALGGGTWTLKGAEYGGIVFFCGETEMPADGQQAGGDVYTTPYLTRRLSLL